MPSQTHWAYIFLKNPSIIWGLSLLGLYSFYIANEQKVNPWNVVIEHMVIALMVIIITHYVGEWIAANLC